MAIVINHQPSTGIPICFSLRRYQFYANSDGIYSETTRTLNHTIGCNQIWWPATPDRANIIPSIDDSISTHCDRRASTLAAKMATPAKLA